MDSQTSVNLLSLPDEILGLILVETLKKSFAIEPDKYWCRIAGACRRLWKLDLPSTPDAVRLCHTDSLKAEGIPWCLKRLRSVKSLAIGQESWRTSEYQKVHQGGRELVKTSPKFPALQMLGMDFYTGLQADQFQPCIAALLQGAPNLEALTMKPGVTKNLHLMSSRSLKHLALSYYGKEWVEGLPDLAALPMLESLKLVVGLFPNQFDILFAATHMPDVCLSQMPKLRHLELVDRYAMRLYASNHDMHWGDTLKSVVPYTTAMRMRREKLYEWPSGLNSYTGLQLLDMKIGECAVAPLLDLAHLRHVPHVRLSSTGCLWLALTEGSWESLELIGLGGVSVAFSDLDAFVTRTKLFSICSSSLWPSKETQHASADTWIDLGTCCGKHGVEQYDTEDQYSILKYGEPAPFEIYRLGNQELQSPFDKEPSLFGALSDLLTHIAETYQLICYDKFWPPDPFAPLELDQS